MLDDYYEEAPLEPADAADGAEHAPCDVCGEYATRIQAGGLRVCGICGEERKGRPVSTGERPMALPSLRVTGGGALGQMVQALVGGGVFGSATDTAVAIFQGLAAGKNSPLANPKVQEKAVEYFTALAEGVSTRSARRCEELVPGCLYEAAVACGVPVTYQDVVAYTADLKSLLAQSGGDGTRKPVGIQKSISEVKRRAAVLGVEATLPTDAAVGISEAQGTLAPYFALVGLAPMPPGLAEKSGLQAVARWSLAVVSGGDGATPYAMEVSPPSAAEARVMERLAQALTVALEHAWKTGLGIRRTLATRRAVLAAILLESWAASGGQTGGDRPSALLADPKYPALGGWAEDSPRLAALRVMIGVAAVTEAKALKQMQARARQRLPPAKRTFPPRGRLLAAVRKTPSNPAATLLAELRSRCRDLNRAVLIGQGLYWPRETYWQNRGANHLGLEHSAMWSW